MALSGEIKNSKSFERANMICKETSREYTVTYIMKFIEEWEKAVAVFKLNK